MIAARFMDFFTLLSCFIHYVKCLSFGITICKVNLGKVTFFNAVMIMQNICDVIKQNESELAYIDLLKVLDK